MRVLETHLRNQQLESHQEIDYRQELLSKLSDEVNFHKWRASGLRDNLYAAEHSLNHLADEIEGHKGYIKQLEQKIKFLTHDLHITRCGYEELQNNLRVAQEGTLLSVKRASWVPKDDGAVRNEFSKLEEKLKAWAKKNAVPDINALRPLSNEEKVEITDYLERYIFQLNFDALLNKMSPPLMKRFPVLITHSMLAKYIFEEIFDNPFFALQHLDTNSKAVRGNAMFGLYKAMINGQQQHAYHISEMQGKTNLVIVLPSDAHIWRSQMLRLLSTAPDSPSGMPLLSAQVFEKFSTKMAKNFLAGPIRPLLKANEAPEQQRNCLLQDLCHIFYTAAKLSTSLWCQRTNIDCRRTTLRKMKLFYHKNPLSTAHRLHHLDEDDDKFDGKAILAIIQPAVVAYGNEDAENYGKGKVWSPAIVLVDEGN